MDKRFFAAWLAVFLAWFAGSFVVHGLLLHADYAQLPNLFRTEEDSQKYFPWMVVAHLLLSAAFVWIYSRGVAAKPWAPQGLRFGIAIAVLNVVPLYLIYYVVQPMPAGTVIKQIVFDSILVVVLGFIVAFMYRARAGAE